MYSLWFYIHIIIIWKNDSKVLSVRLTVWYISIEKRRDAIQDGGYSSMVYPISFVWLGGIYKHDLYHPCCVGEVTFYYYNSLVEGRIFEPYMSLSETPKNIGWGIRALGV